MTLYDKSIQSAAKKYPPKFFGSFLSNRLEFHSEILPIYLFIRYPYNSLISITVMPSSDFGVLENV